MDDLTRERIAQAIETEADLRDKLRCELESDEDYDRGEYSGFIDGLRKAAEMIRARCEDEPPLTEPPEPPKPWHLLPGQPIRAADINGPLVALWKIADSRP